MTGLTPAEAGRRAVAVLDRVEEVVVGKRDALEMVLTGILADGHVLLEDFPGVAKTLIARSMAQATGVAFARVQFTPDLMPSDITGSSVFDQRRATFEFRPGPVFTSLLLGDEINRATPKTQAALLEAMQERQVTVEGVTHRLERPFVVLATQNPIEYEGTYPLPEAQLDRFMLRVGVGYPAVEDEVAMLDRRITRRVDQVVLDPVVDRDELVAMQDALEVVHVADAVLRFVVAIVDATRRRERLQLGASPRGSLALMSAARGRAMIAGRDFVTPDDVKAMVVPCLAHRVSLRPDLWVRGVRPDQVVLECLESVPAPAPDDLTLR